VKAAGGASSAVVGRQEDVRRALKGQQRLPDQMDAQPRATERVSHQLLGVAAGIAPIAVTGGNTATQLHARQAHARALLDAASPRVSAEDDRAVEAAKEVGALSREQHCVVIDL